MDKKKSLILIIAIVALGIVTSIYNYYNMEEERASRYQSLTGSVFHTIYHIKYDADADLQQDIDSLFRQFDGSMSMFNDTSLITRINRNDPDVVADHLFREVFEKGQYVYQMTDGAFDMTVAPLVNLWGFGFKNDTAKITPAQVDSILQFVGMNKVQLLDDGHIVKEDPRIIFDASSIAKGYSCDVIAHYLESRGITNYLIEVGGEITLSGVNEKGNEWSVGISRPVIDTLGIMQGDYQQVLRIGHGGVATSGNYRNFHQDGKKRWGHTIDPHTGYPIQQDVLSSTVIAADCMTADAYATAFMVLGSEKAKEVLARDTTIMVYLICGNIDDPSSFTTICSPKLEELLKKKN